jgi:hypothetical protein
MPLWIVIVREKVGRAARARRVHGQRGQAGELGAHVNRRRRVKCVKTLLRVRIEGGNKRVHVLEVRRRIFRREIVAKVENDVVASYVWQPEREDVARNRRSRVRRRLAHVAVSGLARIVATRQLTGSPITRVHKNALEGGELGARDGWRPHALKLLGCAGSELKVDHFPGPHDAKVPSLCRGEQPLEGAVTKRVYLPRYIRESGRAEVGGDGALANGGVVQHLDESGIRFVVHAPAAVDKVELPGGHEALHLRLQRRRLRLVPDLEVRLLGDAEFARRVGEQRDHDLRENHGHVAAADGAVTGIVLHVRFVPATIVMSALGKRLGRAR